MSSKQEIPDELDLLAFASGRLRCDPSRQRLVQEYLQTHPEVAERVAAYAEQDAMIHAAWDDVAEEPVPDRLLRTLRERRAAPSLRASWALAASLVVGVFIGWQGAHWQFGDDPAPAGHDTQTQTQSTEDDANRADVAAAPTATSAATKLQPLVTPAAPDLSKQGYELAAVHTLESGTAPLVRFSYRRADGSAIDLIAGRHQTPVDAMPLSQGNETVPVLGRWERDGVHYSLRAPIDLPAAQGLVAHFEEMFGPCKPGTQCGPPRQQPQVPSVISEGLAADTDALAREPVPVQLAPANAPPVVETR